MEDYKEILDYIRQVPVIDTHEHLVHSEDLLQGRNDVLQEFLIHYMSSDLLSSGLDPEVLAVARDSERDLVRRWELIERHWEFCRHTGYGRALDDSVREIYGIDGIRGSTIEELGRKFGEANRPGHLKEILKDLCNIELAIIDPWTGRFECDRSLFRRVWQPQNYIIPMPPEFDIVGWLEETYAVEIRSLKDWLEVFELELDENISNGIVGLKSVLAYHRPIRFEEVSLDDAATAFRKALEERGRRSPDRNRDLLIPEIVQDYVMHHILSAANERGIFIQFHTGLLEGNRGILSNSNPELLENLFSKYPRVKFDLFHIGYPYWGGTAALAKTYPNVYIDMCWSHII
ncbi:amidohydrolase family protein, partial [Mesotoga sp.]|uniref:amidohydrolase family protein n=1 Tax=Mesotoga sp. TaxID=2053577 RepID=UPI002631456F